MWASLPSQMMGSLSGSNGMRMSVVAEREDAVVSKSSVVDMLGTIGGDREFLRYHVKIREL